MLPAKASGMRKREGEVPAARAMLTTMGIISATVPVLLTKAPTAAVVTIMRTKRRVSLLPAKPMMRLPAILARPVEKMPPPTTNRPTIMMTMGLEKPVRASSAVSTPLSTSASDAHTATRSERIRPETKSAAEMTRIMSVAIIFFSDTFKKGLKEEKRSREYLPGFVMFKISDNSQPM